MDTDFSGRSGPIMNRNLRHRYPCLWSRLPWRERIGAPLALAGFAFLILTLWVLT